MINEVLKVPDTSRVFFTTDLHGEIDALLMGLEKLKFRAGTDVLICAGDLVDRGTDSFKTATHFLGDKTGSFYSVRGNHDQFAIEGDSIRDLWLMNGGQWAYEGLDDDGRATLGRMLDNLPHTLEVHFKGKTIGVVHAEVPAFFKDWQTFTAALETSPELQQKAIWSRDILYGRTGKDFSNTLLGIDYTVHGHTVIDYPAIIGNRNYIDTGYVFGRYLTIAEFIGDEFVYYRVDPEGRLSVFEEWDLDITT